jgi:hypothetical protein
VLKSSQVPNADDPRPAISGTQWLQYILDTSELLTQLLNTPKRLKSLLLGHMLTTSSVMLSVNAPFLNTLTEHFRFIAQEETCHFLLWQTPVTIDP